MSRSKSTERVPGRGWAYCSVVTGALVSIAANVAHSYVPPKLAPAWWPAGTAWDPKLWHPKLGAVIFAVLWPVALALGTEVLTRIPWPKAWGWNVLRFGGVLPVAAVAGIVSYKHLSALLAFYGEDYLTAHIGPFAIDGLMVVATGALMATAGHGTATRADTAGHPDTPADTPDTTPDSAPDTADTASCPPPETAPAVRLVPVVAATVPDTADTVADTPYTGPDTSPDMSAGPAPAGQPHGAALVSAPDMAGMWADTAPVSAPEHAVPLWPVTPGADTVADTANTVPDTADAVPDTSGTDEADASRWPDTATAVAEIRAAYPHWSSMQIGLHLGVSDRTVRRHLAAAVNGHGTA